MASTKARQNRNREAGALPADAARLLEIILEEIRAPADTQKVLDRWPAIETCEEEARAFLKAKDRYGRREAYITSERLWFNKYGWFMARVATYFGLLCFVFFFAVRGVGVDFLTALILGAAGYYLLLVTLSNLRYRDKNRRRRKLVDAEARRYQRDIVKVASALMKRFGVATERHPIGDPRTPAGLEQREDGYYIPVD
ncbi:MAG TPA: hypothetical protein VK421_18135 [Pyrinomonadaceae bacterium]|nr:hypothetical protein [Pyrinomonadaceae bacterium]